MKRFLLFMLCGSLFQPLWAQISSPGVKINMNPSVAEKLVNLALQNPQLEIADRQISIAQYKLKEEKGWWASSISMSFNANEFSIDRFENKIPANGTYYPLYPLYNFGVSLPIGGIISKPFSVKAAREGVAIAKAERSSQFLQIRAAVLTAYNDYLTNQELLTIQSQLTESSYNDYLQAKGKFRNGQIAVDDYNRSIQSYHDQLASRINAQHNVNQSKIQLEAIVGQPLDNILNGGAGSTGSPADSTGTH